MGFFASAPNADPGYHITSNTWSGGTSYSDYTSAAADSNVTGGQTLGLTVSTTDPGYFFIIDSTSRSFTIKDDVTYANGATGESTVTFTSVAPTGKLMNTQPGSQVAGPTPGDAGNLYVVALSPGIQFQEQVTTGQYTGGDFMFMQIVNNTYSTRTDVNGNSQYQKNDRAIPDGQDFNGPLHDLTPLGYGFSLNGGKVPVSSSFPVAGGGSSPGPNGNPETLDAPYFPGFTNDQKVMENDAFSLYLMYKPTNAGVWIAISEANWSWSETATVNGGALSGGAPSPPPIPVVFQPSGPGAFPVWVNTTDHYVDPNQNPYRRGDPGP